MASYTDQEFGKPEVTYWIGRAFWGSGVATEALTRFLDKVWVRPIYARVAKDNLASPSSSAEVRLRAGRRRKGVRQCPRTRN